MLMIRYLTFVQTAYGPPAVAHTCRRLDELSEKANRILSLLSQTGHENPMPDMVGLARWVSGVYTADTAGRETAAWKERTSRFHTFRNMAENRCDESKRQVVGVLARSLQIAARGKDVFWAASTVAVLGGGLLITGLVYTALDFTGVLSHPATERLTDSRWGVRYDAPGKPVTALRAVGGLLIAGTQENGLHVYDPRTRLWHTTTPAGETASPRYAISHIKPDDAGLGQTWALTDQGGVLAQTAGEWHVVFGSQTLRGEGNDTMTVAAKSGNLVGVGTRHSGMAVYDLRRRAWQAFPDGDGIRTYTVRPGNREETF
ncbi:MAG: hypothetical protein FJY97_07495 [candidate division Zixibacteria bacterium]|nr:hypothetical protein [candidate division Zixibacteria bacterium]